MEGKKMWLIIGLLLLVGLGVLGYKLYKDFKEVDTSMQPIEYSQSFNFEKINQSIFIKTRMWGLLGGHSCIFITESNSNVPNEKTDIVFDRSAIYFKKVEPDSLLIFMTSMSYSEEVIITKNIGALKIKINIFKASLNKRYEDNYKDMGLIKVTTDKGFE